MAKATDTIFALSSGTLPSGVAVVRISGPRALEACRLLVGDVPADRMATLRSIRSRDDEFLDQGLVLVFRGPHSFTGEDCVELQFHGSKAVVRKLLTLLGDIPGLRLAEAGEFSRRAFDNGKLDLLEIEGLADLLAAETEMQRRLASEYSRGGLSVIYAGWRDRLLRARALIEAELDFADEEDIPGAVSDMIWPDLRLLYEEMVAHLRRHDAGEIIRDGFKVVISGPPNAGKSSLINALSRRDVAIVTDIAGTTRDVIQCDLDLGGYVVKLFDTAGIRETADVIEGEGIRRALALQAEADLVLYLNEVETPLLRDKNISVPVLYIGTKTDRLAGFRDDGTYDMCISTRDEATIGALQRRLRDEVEERVGSQNLAIPSRLRHQVHLHASLDELAHALESEAEPLELRAEYLRRCADELGRLTGRIDTEMLLGAIFSEFCVGK